MIARMFNLLAPGLSDRLFVGRLERQIERYLKGETVHIDVGNLDRQRDYAAADDAVEQVRCISDWGISGTVYNVAHGKPVTIRAVLHRMLDAAEVPRSIVREGIPSSGGRKGYDPSVIFADMRRTSGLLRTVQ